MKELATENIAIGVLASIGVLVLIVVFIYVVRQVITRKD
jgi:flagellar biogenesis protein FliO